MIHNVICFEILSLGECSYAIHQMIIYKRSFFLKDPVLLWHSHFKLYVVSFGW
jgi:hypothetical protein